MFPSLPPPPRDLLRAASLFLDFDGTLVEIAQRPDSVRIDAALRALLHTLGERLNGRLALISGRDADAVRSLLGVNAFTVVGSHGMEFSWADGRTDRIERPSGLALAFDAMCKLAADTPGVLIEDKPLGAALHFRTAPEAERACVALATTLAQRYGLYLQSGKMVVEVRASGGDKGSALRRLVMEPEFAAGRPIFMGDDATDEPGFAGAAELGGAGILVGASRPTSARYRLAGVPETLAWLEAACACAE